MIGVEPLSAWCRCAPVIGVELVGAIAVEPVGAVGVELVGLVEPDGAALTGNPALRLRCNAKTPRIVGVIEAAR